METPEGTGTLASEVKSLVSDRVSLGRDMSDEEIHDLITGLVFEKSRQSFFSISEKKAVIETIFNSMRRLDILQPLLDDATITEIMVNGPQDIFAERNGRLFRTGLSFESREKLEDVIQAVVSKANRSVNEASPIVDARLDDGSRVNAVLRPVALGGPVMTIRKFPGKPLSMAELVKRSSLTEEASKALQMLVEAKYNIFICGGTGSGKTTFLNALSGLIPSNERLVTIEDSAELQLISVDNIVRMETRNANTEGRGQITIRDLIKTSLRMRPERIIVGEVRGPEALDMLQAMNTGHDGSLSTGHANSTRDMLSRLETMVLSAAPLPLEAIRQQIAAAIDVFVYLARFRDGSRRVAEICELTGFYKGQIQMEPLFTLEGNDGMEKNGEIPALVRTGHALARNQKLKAAGFGGYL